MPLKGVKVIELAGLAPGPFCGKVLLDFGASVIKVHKMAESFPDVLSNGKKSVGVNLKSKKGAEVFRKLCGSADVLIDPFRKGVLEKLGLGPNELLQKNPKLVCARLSGFGQNGHFSSMAGHDINYLAITGLLSMYGWRGKYPIPPSNFSEFAGGSLICVLGILLALFERTKTGTGQVIDSNITEGISYVGSWLMKSKNTFFTESRGNNLLDGGTHFYDVYETKDGKFMAVGALEPQFYNELIVKLDFSPEELPQLGDFEESRIKLQNKFKQKTQEEWCEVFDLSDACVTPVLTLEEASKHQHNSDRKSFLRDCDGDIMPLPAPRLQKNPPKMDNFQLPSPLGEHTIEVLSELGYSIDQLRLLAANGVIWNQERILENEE
ncbi:alpha-methylacyl-CoA racemase-like [Planococcus citri]|uniref:alpha-methylacyl-CoA racemase-like n=1 Tax=Planococcus citri TaxID=170843 RepID=UPI0031F787AD